MGNIKKGEKFVIIKDFHTDALTSWGKPYTGSDKCVIPKGTILISEGDQLKGARGFAVTPEKYKEMESILIPEATLKDKDYSNYYFVFMDDDYGKYFKKINE